MDVGAKNPLGVVSNVWKTVADIEVGAYLESPDSSDWDIVGNTTDNWTIDFWVMFNEDATMGLVAQSEGFDDYWRLFYSSGNGFRFYVVSGGSLIIDVGYGGPSNVTTGQWYHIALIKVGTKYAIYINGNQVNYTDDSDTDTFSTPLRIGQDGNGYSRLNGYMDEFRIYKGNPFNANPQSDNSDTITVPTSPHTSDSNTKLLIHFDTDISDASSNGHTITNYGVKLVRQPKIDSLPSFLGYRGRWNGSSAYLKMSDSSDWNLLGDTTSDKTWEFWVKVNDDTNYAMLFSQNANGGDDSLRIWHRPESDRGIEVEAISGGSNILLTYTPAIDKEWHWVTIVKKANVIAIYIDGEQKSYATFSSTLDVPEDMYIGAYKGNSGIVSSYLYNGDMDEIRFYNGNPHNADPNSSLTDKIAKQDEEYVSDGNTRLLIHFTNSITDSSGNHSITNNGVTTPYKDETATSLDTFENMGSFGGNNGQTSIAISGLDGDIDEVYFIEARFVQATTDSDVTWYMRLNDDAGSNYNSNVARVEGNNVHSNSSNTGLTGMEIGYTDRQGGITSIVGFIVAKKGMVRLSNFVSMIYGHSGDYNACDKIEIQDFTWTNTADNLTGITFTASVSSCIANGSWIRIYKKR